MSVPLLYLRRELCMVFKKCAWCVWSYHLIAALWKFLNIHQLMSPCYPSSETQGLLAGTMRYFWAKIYFKSWRAEILFLTNQFQKWSNSVPLIGQKKYFSAQSARTSCQVTLSPSYTKYFSSSILFIGPYNGKNINVGSFRKKKKFNEAEETASLNMGARNHYYSIHFSANLSKVYRKFL